MAPLPSRSIMRIAPNEHNLRYLKTKEERMHHTLGLDKK